MSIRAFAFRAGRCWRHRRPAWSPVHGHSARMRSRARCSSSCPMPPARAWIPSRARRSLHSPRRLDASVIVDNQPGAGGVVGLQALARAAPDGNTLVGGLEQCVIFPSVIKSLPFDMPGDFTPIAIVGATPMVLVVNPARVPATNARSSSPCSRASPGNSTSRQAATARSCTWRRNSSWRRPDVSAKHIPYKGVGPMVAGLIGGQVDFATAALPSVQPHIKSGALRAIGMLTAAAHSRGAGHSDLCRARVAELRRRRLVRGHRTQGHEPGQHCKGPRCGVCRVRGPGGQAGHDQSGQHHRHQHARAGESGVPQRNDKVRGLGQEGGHRAGIGDPIAASRIAMESALGSRADLPRTNLHGCRWPMRADRTTKVYGREDWLRFVRISPPNDGGRRKLTSALFFATARSTLEPALRRHH